MQYFTIDRRQAKLDARGAMHSHRPSVYLIAFVFLLISLVLTALDNRLQMPQLTEQQVMGILAQDEAAIRQFLIASEQNRSFAGSILSIAIAVMTVMLTGGFSLACYNVARGQAANVGTLFELFNWFFRFLWLEILQAIFIFLWSLLLVVPGIVAAYRYSMAPYIFFDDPEKGALQCIRESKAMTRGFKGQLFVLDLSFIGWFLLSLIPLVSIFVLPYYDVTKANFYRALADPFYGQPQQPGPGSYDGRWNP